MNASSSFTETLPKFLLQFQRLPCNAPSVPFLCVPVYLIRYRLQALQSDAMALLANTAQTAKLTLDSREDFVVDLSTELVEKDLQVERLSQRIATLEQQVEIRDNTVDVLENQLHDVQRELEEANDHLDMHCR